MWASSVGLPAVQFDRREKGQKKPESPTGGGGSISSTAAAHGGHSQHNGNADAGCIVM